MLWFHGTPGGRRQVPESLRRHVGGLGVRLVVVERPGYGASTRRDYDEVRTVTADVDELLEALGIDRFCVAALSGGGPYALACAHDFPDRVVAASILGGVAPHVGPDAVPGGTVGALAPLGGIADTLAAPVGTAIAGIITALAPVASPGLDLVARLFPAGDREVFARPDIKAMFIDDIVRTARHRVPGPALDLRVFVRPWGFALGDVAVPVHFWHGDADPIVTIAQARHMADRVPNATFVLRPGESHLGAFAVAEDAVVAAMAHWDEAAGR